MKPHGPLWVGIDPGKNGALATLDESGGAAAFDWHNEQTMLNILRTLDGGYDVKFCCIERVGARPGQGVTSMFSFGQNYGFWLGAVGCLMWPIATVTPQTWMKGLVGKEGAMPVAARMFPTVDLCGPRGGARDGRADALLLAHVARTRFGREA